MTTNTTLATLNPAIIGQAEKHHIAVLTRALSGTTLDEKQWITLNQALAAGAPVERATYVARVAGMTQWAPFDVETALVALVEGGLVRELPGNQAEVTDTGAELVTRVRAAAGEIIGAAYGSVPAEDMAIAARVLTTITARMAEALALA